MEERVERKIIWFVVISLFISLVLIAILFSSKFGKTINKLAVYNNFITDNIQRFHQSIKWFAKHPSPIFFVFCICICVQFERVIASYVIAKSLGLDIHILDFIIFVPITFIIVMIPISIGGFGVQEASYVYFFGLMGVGANEAFSISLLANLLTILVVAPGGLLYAKGGFSGAKKLRKG